MERTNAWTWGCICRFANWGLFLFFLDLPRPIFRDCDIEAARPFEPHAAMPNGEAVGATFRLSTFAHRISGGKSALCKSVADHSKRGPMDSTWFKPSNMDINMDIWWGVWDIHIYIYIYSQLHSTLWFWRGDLGQPRLSSNLKESPLWRLEKPRLKE